MRDQVLQLTKDTDWEWGGWTQWDQLSGLYTYTTPVTDQSFDHVAIRTRPDDDLFELKWYHSHPDPWYDFLDLTALVTEEFSKTDKNHLSAFRITGLLVTPSGCLRQFTPKTRFSGEDTIVDDPNPLPPHPVPTF